MPRTAGGAFTLADDDRTPRARRWGCLVTLALVAVTALGGWWGVRRAVDAWSPTTCEVRAGGKSFTWAPDQASNSAVITAIALRRGMAPRAATIAIATALQESKVRNITFGDRDSVGLFQQRPSQGWGTVEQIMNPVYASERFFRALAKVDGYNDKPMAEAAQAVQRSANGSFYAQHEGEALALAQALTGRYPQALTCLVKPATVPQQQVSANGLTPRANTVRTRLRDVFGTLSLGGFAPGGVSDGHMDGSAHYEGRAIDVFFRPITEPNTQQGWEVAHWLVAHAHDLNIATVIYAERIWSADASTNGWSAYTPPRTDPDPAVNEVLRHQDHVHVDVLKGD